MTKRHMLYIDDNTTNLELIQRLLQRKGYNCIVSQNPEQGIEIAKQYNPPLIFLDIQMPEMSGYEVLQRLRQSQQFENIPIIALTANVMPDDRAKTIQAGFDDYLPKPVYREQLYRIVEKHLKQTVKTGV